MIAIPQSSVRRELVAGERAQRVAYLLLLGGKQHAAAWDRGKVFPRDALRALGALGVMGVVVPERWGGAGLDTVSLAVALEEIAAGDGATSTIVSVQNSVVCGPLNAYGTDAQKARWLVPLARGESLGCFCLTEPGAGSDAAAIATRAERRGDGYVLNGVKQFITSGANADVAIVFAVTDRTAAKRGISAFVVDARTSGFRVARVEEKLGQRASDTAQIAFEDCVVPADARLGAEGEGYRIALSNLESGRIGIAAQSIGMARAAFEAARAYAAERHAFGKPIGEHQAVAFRLADMATRIEAARLLVWRAAKRIDAGLTATTESAMAKLTASETAMFCSWAAVQTLGGWGYSREFLAEKWMRDAKLEEIEEGTSDIQRLVIARSLR